MSKRAIFLAILLPAIAAWIVLLALAVKPGRLDLGVDIAAFAILGGGISACARVAEVPGPWGEKLDLQSAPVQRHSRAWPFFMVILFVCNWIIGAAVFLGSLLFQPKGPGDPA